jgi:BirA family biotin operon repressor/biotin-[acetyl-CoA-carboxylase] ligase
MKVLRLEICGSTMMEAARLADEGAPHGTAVVAEEQTEGRGRLGRSWHSERGAGLYVSIVLRVDLKGAGALPMALGLATGEAIRTACGIACDLRWPNDVLIGDKKVAGVLVQTAGPAYITGIGVNVNHTTFPSELAVTATSLRMISGKEQPREALLEALLPAVERWAAFAADAFARASSYVRGKRVIVEENGAVLEGVTEGLDEHGLLRLRRADGTRVTILNGGVRACS